MKTADLAHRTVYRLARTVTNPTPDRRRARDFWALAEWPEGLLVYAFEDKHTNPRRPHWRMRTRRFHGDVCDTAEGGAFEALIDALEPVHTLESVLYAAKESQAVINATEILAELIEAKLITLENVEIAIMTLIARHEVECDAITEATTGGLESKS